MEDFDREADAALESLLKEHLPGELLVAWTIEVLDEMGLGRPELEDIPPEVGFRVRQRMLQHVAERTSGPLSDQLRETYRYNEEHGLAEEEEEE